MSGWAFKKDKVNGCKLIYIYSVVLFAQLKQQLLLGIITCPVNLIIVASMNLFFGFIRAADNPL